MTTAPLELLTTDELVAMLKISRAGLYLLMERDGFPKPIKLGTHNRWRLEVVEEWLETQQGPRVA